MLLEAADAVFHVSSFKYLSALPISQSKPRPLILFHKFKLIIQIDKLSFSITVNFSIVLRYEECSIQYLQLLRDNSRHFFAYNAVRIKSRAENTHQFSFRIFDQF